MKFIGIIIERITESIYSKIKNHFTTQIEKYDNCFNFELITGGDRCRN
jgi:hypothetical protein